MKWHTHAAMGASAVSLLLPFLPPDDSALVAVLMVFAVVGTLIPDLDAVESKIKHVRVGSIKPFMPVARALNREFGHRGMLHSLRGWLIWMILILPLAAWAGGLLVAALALGYASHIAGDACTRTGIPPLYPKRERFYLLPQRLRVITGSEYEELVFAAFTLSAVAMLLEHLEI